jgi:hypothetical protein
MDCRTIGKRTISLTVLRNIEGKTMQSPVNFFTTEEYLQLEQTSEIRHEYLGGQVFAMSGGSKENNIITLNIASRVRSHLRGSSCSVFMADMKVRIELANQIDRSRLGEMQRYWQTLARTVSTLAPHDEVE